MARGLPYAALVSVQLVFSGYHLLGKQVLRGGVHPLAFAVQREVGATAVLLGLAARFPRPSARHLGRVEQQEVRELHDGLTADLAERALTAQRE